MKAQVSANQHQFHKYLLVYAPKYLTVLPIFPFHTFPNQMLVCLRVFWPCFTTTTTTTTTPTDTVRCCAVSEMAPCSVLFSFSRLCQTKRLQSLLQSPAANSDSSACICPFITFALLVDIPRSLYRPNAPPHSLLIPV
jgi:hypothetical protein